jgi:hypothetical protein
MKEKGRTLPHLGECGEQRFDLPMALVVGLYVVKQHDSQREMLQTQERLPGQAGKRPGFSPPARPSRAGSVLAEVGTAPPKKEEA